MVVFDVNSVWSRRIRRAAVVAVASVSLLGSELQHAFAEKPSRAKVPKIAESAEPRSNNSFDEAIRKLLKEAKTAESKGEIDRAVFLAERAAKISESSSELVKTSKDVSPAATASYARVLRQKRSELIAKQKAAEAGNEIEVAKTAPARKSGPVAATVPAPQAPEVVQQKPVVAAEPAVASARKVEKVAHQEVGSSVSKSEEVPPSPKMAAREERSVGQPTSRQARPAIKPAAAPVAATQEVAEESPTVAQSSRQAQPATLPAAMEKSPVKAGVPSSTAAQDAVLQAEAETSPTDSSWDAADGEATSQPVVSSAGSTSESVAANDAEVAASSKEDFDPVSPSPEVSGSELAGTSADEPAMTETPQPKASHSASLKTSAALVKPAKTPDATATASKPVSTRTSRDYQDIREAIHESADSPDGLKITASEPVVAAVETTPPIEATSTPTVKLRKRQPVDLRRQVVTSEPEESPSLHQPTPSGLLAEDSLKSSADDWSHDDVAAEASGAQPDVRSAIVHTEVKPAPAAPIVESENTKPHGSVAVKIRPAFRSAPSTSAADVQGPAAVSVEPVEVSADAVESVAKSDSAKTKSHSGDASEAIAKTSTSVVQPFRLRKSYRDRQTGELEAITPESRPSESQVARSEFQSDPATGAASTTAPVATSDLPVKDLEPTTTTAAVAAQTMPSGKIKVRSAFREPLNGPPAVASTPANDWPDSGAKAEKTRVAQDVGLPRTNEDLSKVEPSVSESITLTPFRLRSRVAKPQRSVSDAVPGATAKSPEWAEEISVPVAKTETPAMNGDLQPIDSQVSSAPVTLSPFKLRTRNAESLEKADIKSSGGIEKGSVADDGAATVAKTDLVPDSTRAAVTDSSMPRANGPLKLRSSFRDSQFKTSAASDGAKGTAVEAESQQPIVIVKHEAADESAEVPVAESPATTPKSAGTLKLRPSFREPQRTSPKSQETSADVDAEATSGSDASATAKTTTKGEEGRSSLVQWRSSKSDATALGDDAAKSVLSTDGNLGQSKSKSSGGKSPRGAASTADAQGPAVHQTAHKQMNRAASDAQAERVHSADSASPSVKKELRASLWDSAPAPGAEAPMPSESILNAPLPPQRDGQVEGIATGSSRKEGADLLAKRESASPTRNQSSESLLKADLLVPGDDDADHALKSRRRERPVAHEDDHAASTRAILASGPIQRLVRLTGIGTSSASALVVAFGMVMLIGGLWLLRATMGFRQAQ